MPVAGRWREGHRGRLVLGRQLVGDRFRFGQGRIDGLGGEGLALEGLADRTDFVPQAVEDPLRLLPCVRDDLLALAACLAALLGGLAQGLGAAQLHGAGLVPRGAGLALGRLQGGQGLLERSLRVGQARTGIGDDPVRQAEALGDGEGLASAGQADR